MRVSSTFCLTVALALIAGCTSPESKKPDTQKISKLVGLVEKTKQSTLMLLLVEKKLGTSSTPKEWYERNGMLVYETAVQSNPFKLDLGSVKIPQLEGEVVFDRGWISKSLKVTATYHEGKTTSTTSVAGKSNEPVVVSVDAQKAEYELFAIVVNP